MKKIPTLEVLLEHERHWRRKETIARNKLADVRAMLIARAAEIIASKGRKHATDKAE